MEQLAESKEFNLYRDIKNRTGGEIYIGVVGPVRTGKSTFIRRFMDLMVLPFLEDAHSRERALDELPQAAAGKTIMTTEPKFIPQEAAQILLNEGNSVKIRFIDCVGFMVKGAAGHLEGNEDRMVKTPWFDYEIPFVDAAEIGTEKVIRDHATIGFLVTTDGSIGELERGNYIEAEEKTVKELSDIGKPFVVLLNSQKPYSEETIRLAGDLREKYKTPVVPVNCEQLRKDDALKILETVLYEFPVNRVEFFIPKWTEMLAPEHRMKKELIQKAGEILSSMQKARDIAGNSYEPGEYVSAIQIEQTDLAKGCVKVRMDVADRFYYENISELTGVPIQGEYQLISMIKEMAEQKSSYEKIADAFEAVTPVNSLIFS